MPRKALRVAILVETSTSWGRGIAWGIGRYARQFGPWELYLEPSGYNESPLLPAGWTGDGIIARVHEPALVARIKRTGVPVVNVSGLQIDGAEHWPRVMTDQVELARTAFGHLRNQGFQQFAFFGPDRFKDRGQIFHDVVTAQSGTCSTYYRVDLNRHSAGWQNEQKRVAAWLKALPRPVGIMTVSAMDARHLAEACRMVDLRVPDDVALISVDTDELVSEIVTPSLSGVQIATEKIGYEAASLLHRMMRKEPVTTQCLLVPVMGIVTRQSTNVLAVDDVTVRSAMVYVRENAHTPIGVRDIAAAVGVSRRVLERRFQEVLGRSPAQEIRRAHLDRAKELLVQTDLPVPKVAAAAGFNHVERMIAALRNDSGLTPLAYRKRVQAGGG